MKYSDLLSQITLGEDSTRQFKADIKNADELPTKASINKVDKLRFRDFLRDVYEIDYPDSSEERTRLLQNMNLTTDDGNLNLGGLLMFGEQPELIMPQFVVKGVRYPGNEIHASDYMDTEDFVGPLPKIFADVLAFIMRNLHKVQAGRGEFSRHSRGAENSL
ncbi:hypothetical protein VU04_11845 [Desulfobulbus sp. TB]|nr:hypothetical protein [Desulfobulbus sp. TB]